MLLQRTQGSGEAVALPPDKHPEVGLLDGSVVPCLVFGGPHLRVSTGAAPISKAASRHRLPPPPTSTSWALFVCLDDGHSDGCAVRGGLAVGLICISRVDPECSAAPHGSAGPAVSSLEKRLLRPFAHCLTRLWVWAVAWYAFLLFCIVASSQMYGLQIFSPS